MVEAVFIFAVLMAISEFVLISMIAPRWRLRLLGSSRARTFVHLMAFSLNLLVHWGTLTGTMAATGAFCVSMVTVWFARIVFGEISGDVLTRRGLLRFNTQELVR